MRVAFFKELQRLAQSRNDIYILTADLGFKLFDELRAEYPDRFYNVGIAESNMIGVAAGLTLSGKNVYCYSMIPFIVMRAFEQVRVDIAYHGLNVKLVGVGGGFTYGLEGFTHFAIEDFSLMRALPGMTIVAPADIFEAMRLAELSYSYPYPLYIRMGATGDPPVHEQPPSFEIGKGMILREGRDVAIFAVGNMVHAAKLAVSILNGKGISITLVNMHTIKPLDVDLVNECMAGHDVIVTVEEHSITGGLGSAVAEVLSERSYKGRFKRIGIQDTTATTKNIGTADYLRRRYGLVPEKIADTIVNELQRDIVWVGK